MKINDKMRIDGMNVRLWMNVCGICAACPYLSEECYEEDECEMIEKWIAEGRIEIG